MKKQEAEITYTIRTITDGTACTAVLRELLLLVLIYRGASRQPNEKASLPTNARYDTPEHINVKV